MKRILVVDDERPLVELLSHRLKSWGYEVLAATNGEEGLRVAEAERPDLVLLDIRMPGMNGREMCARLRSRRELSQIPVIFLTALGMPDQIEEAFLAEPDDYIVKPFKPGELKDRIQNCLMAKA